MVPLGNAQGQIAFVRAEKSMQLAQQLLTNDTGDLEIDESVVLISISTCMQERPIEANNVTPENH